MVDHPADRAWIDVERYLSETLVKSDDALQQAVSSARQAEMPPIEVAPTAGKLLMLLARLSGARHVLEIGTLAGYSTIWLARGVPEDGTVTTLEFLGKHADVARSNVDRAGVGHKVTIRQGSALETLPLLEAEGAGPFDLVFIDADKVSNVAYLRWALRLSRPGGVIVLDNAVWNGTITDARNPDADVRGIRAALEFLGTDPRVEATAIQTVGSKGWDGFALAVIK